MSRNITGVIGSGASISGLLRGIRSSKKLPSRVIILEASKTAGIGTAYDWGVVSPEHRLNTPNISSSHIIGPNFFNNWVRNNQEFLSKELPAVFNKRFLIACESRFGAETAQAFA